MCGCLEPLVFGHPCRGEKLGRHCGPAPQPVQIVTSDFLDDQLAVLRETAEDLAGAFGSPECVLVS
jgi:hypothetical protein